MARKLEQWGRFSITQPLSRPVASNEEEYAAHTGIRKLGWRHLRRLIYFKLSGQQKLHRAAFEPAWRRGLWLYRGVPQIGDALMDLAPRSLLMQNGLIMDLCTDPHLATLFADDPWFGQVFTPGNIGATENYYDFVIVQSHKSRSLEDKRKLFCHLPWLSIHGFFTGPEFHRAEFATQRLLDMIPQTPDLAGFSAHARQKLKPLQNRQEIDKNTSTKALAIAFALGGVDPLRTYRHWVELAVLLSSRFELIVTLLGSANATDMANDFLSSFSGTTINRVDQTSLEICREIMQAQDIVVACDGGLMHLAVTTDTQLVSLFHSGVHPAWRLPPDRISTSLQASTEDVSEITPESIAWTIDRLVSVQQPSVAPSLK